MFLFHLYTKKDTKIGYLSWFSHNFVVGNIQKLVTFAMSIIDKVTNFYMFLILRKIQKLGLRALRVPSLKVPDS